MRNKSFTFSNSTVDYYFDAEFSYLENLVSKENAVVITDENIFEKHKRKFKGWNCIVLKPGEAYKVQKTVDEIIDQLIEIGADRKTILIGVGGGVVTDITGYVAGIFMRGIKCGFVPTSILAMVDASIGGKNGIDVGVYKNMVGLIRQPLFLLYDPSFLKSLPQSEWQNGFAEIIKHASIKDAKLFELLAQNNLASFKRNPKLLSKIIERNALIKTKVVVNDEFEQGERKLLNFGHTLGHAIENMYDLSHGQAISIGMVFASALSGEIYGFADTEKLRALFVKYGLPTDLSFNKKKAFEILQKDKKKDAKSIHYILLKKIGKGVMHSMSFEVLESFLKKY